jgi:uncharacterized protein YdhG (YjbR/CyaY superfamily)
MTVVDEYLTSLDGAEKAIISHMYGVVREMVPDASEALSYNMPAFKKDGKAFIAIMANKDFMSVYPFSNLEPLGLDFSDYECTKGSIHFTLEHPISDDLLRTIITARLKRPK